MTSARVDRAIEALGRADPRSALSALLEEWAHAPAAELEPLIDELGILARPPIDPLTEKKWVALAQTRDPALVPWLTASAFHDGGAMLTARHLELLAGFGPDPRLWALAAMWLDARRLLTHQRLLEPLLQLLLASPSPRSRPVLERLQRDLFGRRVPRPMEQAVADALAKTPGAIPVVAPPLQPLRAALKAAGAMLASGRRTIDQLFDAVYAQPDSDEARAVLADALLEQEDLRGEFISLQLNEQTRSGRRAAELLAQVRDEWLLPFVDFMPAALVDFTRGFPDSAYLSGPPLHQASALRTLREVTFDSPHGACLAGADFASVRTLIAPAAAVLEAVRTGPARWQSLKLSIRTDAEAQAVIDAARAGAFPDLQTLIVDAPTPWSAAAVVMLATQIDVKLELTCLEASFKAQLAERRLTLAGKRRAEHAEIAQALLRLPERGLEWLTVSVFGGAGAFEQLAAKALHFEVKA